jgi:hypothetical protein
MADERFTRDTRAIDPSESPGFDPPPQASDRIANSAESAAVAIGVPCP